MKVVVDANIIFSALISDGMSAKLLANKKLELVVPEYLFEEVNKYRELIIRKSGLNNQLFLENLKLLKARIITLNILSYEKFIPGAKIICPDPKDIPYFALSLMLKIPVWSNDKKLKEQNKIKIYNTEEIIQILN